MSASQTLESYLASFRRHKPLPRVRAYVPVSRPKPPAVETDSLSVSTISSIDTEMLLRSDTSEIVVKQAYRPQIRTKASHRKNVHSLPLSIIQENSEAASRAYFHYDIQDYLPHSGTRMEYRKAAYRKPQVRKQTEVVRKQTEIVRKQTEIVRKQKFCQGKKQTVDKQSTVSSVDTDALLQSSEDEFDGENFPISHFTRELLEKRPMCRPDSSGSISPRYNPLVSIGSTSRASPLPPNPRKDADIQIPLISPSPDLTTHTRTMSMPISPARGRKLSEAAMVMVENNKQVFLCPSQRSEEKASLESTLQKCLAAQRNCFQDQRPSPTGNVSVTPKFSTKPNLRIRHPFEQSCSTGREENSQRPSETSSDPSEAFEAFCREQSQKAEEPEAPTRVSPRRKGARTYIKLKVCTCILSGLINSHKPGCRVTTVTALLPTSDSNNSSFASLCNLKSGTTHSHMHTTGSRSAFDASVREETKRKKQLSIVEAVVMIQRKVRGFLKRRKDAVSLAYSRSTNDRSAANADIERATQSIYSAIGHLQELKSSQRNQGVLSLDELTVSGPQTDADLLDLSSEQFGRVIRQGELHAVTQNSWSDFLQRESGETLWIDASASSIEGLGSKELNSS